MAFGKRCKSNYEQWVIFYNLSLMRGQIPPDHQDLDKSAIRLEQAGVAAVRGCYTMGECA